MYRQIKNIQKELRKEEILKLDQFKRKNPDQDIYVYYITTNIGYGFQYIASTEKPKIIDSVTVFDNYEDITDYDNRIYDF